LRLSGSNTIRTMDFSSTASTATPSSFLALDDVDGAPAGSGQSKAHILSSAQLRALAVQWRIGATGEDLARAERIAVTLEWVAAQRDRRSGLGASGLASRLAGWLRRVA